MDSLEILLIREELNFKLINKLLYPLGICNEIGMNIRPNLITKSISFYIFQIFNDYFQNIVKKRLINKYLTSSETVFVYQEKEKSYKEVKKFKAETNYSNYNLLENFYEKGIQLQIEFSLDKDFENLYEEFLSMYQVSKIFKIKIPMQMIKFSRGLVFNGIQVKNEVMLLQFIFEYLFTHLFLCINMNTNDYYSYHQIDLLLDPKYVYNGEIYYQCLKELFSYLNINYGKYGKMDAIHEKLELNKSNSVDFESFFYIKTFLEYFPANQIPITDLGVKTYFVNNSERFKKETFLFNFTMNIKKFFDIHIIDSDDNTKENYDFLDSPEIVIIKYKNNIRPINFFYTEIPNVELYLIERIIFVYEEPDNILTKEITKIRNINFFVTKDKKLTKEDVQRKIGNRNNEMKFKEIWVYYKRISNKI
jgi:hypothetical protein